MAEAMFEYAIQHVGDLALKVGDKVEVTRKGDDGWWTGILRGVTGNFPGEPREIYGQIKNTRTHTQFLFKKSIFLAELDLSVVCFFFFLFQL